MEFHFDVNYVLPDDITVIDSKLYPFKAHHVKEKGADMLRKSLEQVIDKMGMASSKAQNLKATITSYGKLSHSDHRLYLLKDSTANGGKGAVIGLIKVGKKRLFLVDIHSQQLEVNPLCVLDFYVHEQQQRSGYGHRLFNFMLEMEGVKPQFLAYDRPSPKFINFLRKHFDLQNIIHQMNKFVVFDLFFRDLSAVGYVPRNRRFVSSAPSESRIHATPDSRLISSASLFGRSQGGTLNDIRTHDKTSTNFESTLSNTCENESPLGSLPPKLPGRSSTFYNDSTWTRRNASHLPFARDSTASTKVRDHRKNLYSRHSYREMEKREQSPSQVIRERAAAVVSDSLLNIRCRREEIGNERVPSLNNVAIEGKSVVLPGIEKPIQSQVNNDNSYSVDKMYKQRHQHTSLGTSWNLFGVPGNMNNNTRSKGYKRNQNSYFY